MMQGSSPRRNMEPLLEGESPPPAAVNGSGYAPPGQEAPQVGIVPPQPQPQEVYDLGLTVTDEQGNVIPMEEEPVPQLPPLISYCSYVKFAFAFSKWLLLVVIANVVGLAMVLADDYFGYQSMLPFDSFKGGVLAIIWLGTAAWLYLAAKVVERDVDRFDQMAQYERGSLSEQQPHDGDGTTTNPMSFVPNYDAIYGQVSRKLDSSLAKKTLSGTSPSQPQQPPATGTSSLVSFSYALCGLALGAGVFMGVGFLAGKSYLKSCDRKSNLPDGNSTDSNFKGDFSNIANFPSGIQDWITEKRDPWNYPRHYDYDDDYRDNNMMPVYDFPVAYETDEGLFCHMLDGTLFFAGQSQTPEDNDGSRSNHLVLVQASPDGTIVYHDDIVNPRMFIPVVSTMDDNKDAASQFCFTAANDKNDKNRQRSWDNVIRTTPIYCIIESGSDFDIGSTLISWTDKSQRGPKVTAAATGSQILIAHVGVADRYTYQEVVAVTPDKMDSKSVVYHFTSTESDSFYIDEYGGRNYEVTKCIQEHVLVFSTIAALVALVGSSLWLILREGIASGVVPLTWAVAALIYGLFVGAGRDRYYRNSGWANMALTIGTIFFHIVLCCGGDGRACQLPSWIGRDMYVFGLYGWLTGFIIIDLVWGDMDVVLIMGLVYFALSGLILDHPTLAIMGYLSVIIGIFMLILTPFFGYNMFDIFPGLMSLLLGLGMVSVSNCFSSHRGYITAFCRLISRAFHAMYYGGSGAAAAATPAAPRGPVPVRV